MWQPSPSPEETWSDASGANDDGEWPVKAVVGEEVRLDGTSRYSMLYHPHYPPSQPGFADMKYESYCIIRLSSTWLTSVLHDVGEMG